MSASTIALLTAIRQKIETNALVTNQEIAFLQSCNAAPLAQLLLNFNAAVASRFSVNVPSFEGNKMRLLRRVDFEIAKNSHSVTPQPKNAEEREKSKEDSRLPFDAQPATPRATVSERKRLANQLNAKKSTGPRTPAGKEKVRRNATKHNLLGTVTTSRNNNEAEAYKTFVLRLKTICKPVSSQQQELVEEAASLLWTLNETAVVIRLLLIRKVPGMKLESVLAYEERFAGKLRTVLRYLSLSQSERDFNKS